MHKLAQLPVPDLMIFNKLCYGNVPQGIKFSYEDVPKKG
jgi:hypothetical protein